MSSHVIFWQTPPSPSSDDVIYEQPLNTDDDIANDDNDNTGDRNNGYNDDNRLVVCGNQVVDEGGPCLLLFTFTLYLQQESPPNSFHYLQLYFIFTLQFYGFPFIKSFTLQFYCVSSYLPSHSSCNENK